MDLEQEAARRVGTTLRDTWTLDRLIGTGGMAAVYEASDKLGGREAIKVLHADVARDPEIRARFEQEAQAGSHFKHPGTVEVREVDVSEDGAPFMVMELLDGQPLSEIARRPGGVPVGDLLRLVDELLDVLAAAHARGIIHRDVKPDNLFVLRDGHLKVLDFGIARVRAGVPPKLLTRAGDTLGTAPYMPPEQINGVDIDARADLFAVGATMFRLLAKRRVHEADTDTQVLLKMASEPAPSLAGVAPGVPRDVCRVVDRALMFERDRRYPDARTMQDDVRALREGQPPPHATARDGSPGPAAGEPHTVVVPRSARGGASGAAITGSEPTAAMPIFPDPDARPPLVNALASTVPATFAPTASSSLPAVLGPAATTSSSSLPAVLGPAAATSSSSLPAVLAPAVAASPSSLPAVLGPATTLPATLGPAGAANGAAEPIERTMRPGPAPLAVKADGAATVPSSAVPTPEPTTRPMTQVPVVDSADASKAAPPGYAPLSERTLRSQGVVAPVKAAGYVVTPVVQMARPPGPVHGPPTQPAGMAPLAPGESIPVVAPSRLPREPGEMNVLPLVIVGVVFAAIGIGLTLWLMLSNPAETAAAPSAEPTNEPPAETGPRWPLRAPPRTTAAPHVTSTTPPRGPGLSGPHGKPPHGR